jgi:hypothetical protein
MKINGEKGQALIFAMIAIMLGAMVLPAFLIHTDTSLIGSRYYKGSIYGQYACDSGAEHAIWSLVDGDLADQINELGDWVNYTLPESINGLTANITVCKSYLPIAWDDFNSGTWSGGGGWLDNWTHTGESLITNSGTPYEGAYHLRLRSNGTAKRPVDLSQWENVYLSFYSKVNSLESSDNVECQISSDGNTWTTIESWNSLDSDNTYHYKFIPLTDYEMTGQFWISFNGHMSGTNDYFYVDKLALVWLAVVPSFSASDDFESGNIYGGTGWLTNWALSGYESLITWFGWPHQGMYHLQERYTGIARRSVDLSAAFMVTLQVWVKVSGFESNDYANLRVSSDGTHWSTAYTWGNSVSDGVYHLYTIDLSQYEMSSQFWISFEAHMNQSDDYFYVDEINLTDSGYGIIVTAGDTMLRAVVQVNAYGGINIVSWYYL